MSNIVEKTKLIAEECAKSLQLEIVDVEWVREYNQHILRILADKMGGLTVEDCTQLNEAISLKLDEDDFIDHEYMLEVSSPGIERPLKNDKDITQAIGEYIYIKAYQNIDGQKVFEGYLQEFDGNIVTISVNQKGRNKVFKIEKNKISTIRLAVKF